MLAIVRKQVALRLMPAAKMALPRWAIRPVCPREMESQCSHMFQCFPFTFATFASFCPRSAAVRFMGSRVPLPAPTWKQAERIEDTVATNMDQATGLERAEMLANMEGRNIFDDHPIGHFGTKENPYIVESIFTERIGEYSNKRRKMWKRLFECLKGAPSRQMWWMINRCPQKQYGSDWQTSESNASRRYIRIRTSPLLHLILTLCSTVLQCKSLTNNYRSQSVFHVLETQIQQTPFT